MGLPSNRRKQGHEEPPGHSILILDTALAKCLLRTLERLCKLFIAWTKLWVPFALTLVLVTCSQNKPLPANLPQQPHEQQPTA